MVALVTQIRMALAAAWSLQVVDHTPGFMWPLIDTMGQGINIDLGYSWPPDIVLASNLGLVATIVPGGCNSHSDLYGSSSNMAGGPKHDPSRWPSPLKSAWQLIAIGAMAINTNRSYCRTKDPDMAADVSLSQVSSIPPPQSTPHCLHHGPRWQTGLQHLPAPGCPHSSLSSFLPFCIFHSAWTILLLSPISLPHISLS